MTSVSIISDGFSRATELMHIVSQRGLDARLAAYTELKKSDALVIAGSVADDIGGMEKVVEQCREYGIRKIVIVRTEQGQDNVIRTAFGGAVAEICGDECGFPFSCELVVQFLGGGNGFAAGDANTFKLLSLASRVANSDVTVFINGPTGTGKEVLAKYVHAQSERAAKAFIAVNCAAIPDNMLEAMLFGYEKGAFTGASTANKGIFRAADGGTLLLDEISEMPLGLQAKILRALQERMVTPLGGQRDIPIDVRVIATTNRDMGLEVREGRFREDLFYRLNVFPLETSPLSERKGDLLPVATALIFKHVKTIEKMPWLQSDVLQMFEEHAWPGNIRELENVLQRALVLSDTNQIAPENIMLDRTVATALSMLDSSLESADQQQLVSVK